MRRKRVLFFIESFSGGGAERVLLTILRNLDMTRFDITVLVVSDIGVYRKDFHSLNITIIPVLNCNSRLINKVKYKLVYNILPPKMVARWLLKGIEADTYVAFVEGYCTKILSHLRSDKRKIAWVHTDLNCHPWTIAKGIYHSSKEEKEAYTCFDISIGVSNDVSNVLKNQYGLKSICTIYNPIDESRIVNMSRVQPELNIDKSKFNVISVGRLTQPKGYDKLIDLMPKILASNPSVRLYIVGEGEERQKLEHQIKELNLSDKVILTGFMENPYSLMRDMDLFVCSSVAEGFSLVVAEAFIVGLPVISMECSGPVELLGQGEYGLLCSTYDELANKIAQVSQDNALLQELCNKSKRRASDFNTRNIISTIENIL